MEEVWREVEGFPSYEVSNYGMVRSLHNDFLLKQRPNEEGYMRVVLSQHGVAKEFYVHQLVAMMFFPGYLDGAQVSHVNGDRTNNATNNLRLRRGDPFSIRERRPDRRETWGMRVMVVETGDIFASVRDCAAYIGGDYSAIYACLRGERRKHLGYSFELVETD